ncbi:MULTISPECIES: hypothetical protein [Rhizobium]|nr:MULTISPECIES: hypothetical protein [Rhizobium]NEI94580.1 hypothetical protein [Rhizobium leguminosarum]NEJ78805.1 hypothetical protein [Rhizobium leguminosarum]
MAKKPTPDDTPEPAVMIPDDQHPDYADGMISDPDDLAAMAAIDEFPLQPNPGPFPLPLPPTPLPGPLVPLPLNICGPVSGRYARVLVPPPGQIAPLPLLPGFPVPPTQPPTLFPPTFITVRVDVDRFFPQRRISVEARRLFPNQTSHLIAEVTSDACIGYFKRRIAARITYRDGPAALIPGDNLIFEAKRAGGRGYGTYTLTLRNGGTTVATHSLAFQSIYFDAVEFEVDRVADAAAPTTTHATQSHPNRPADLPNETISMATVYQRAGFEVTMSPNSSLVPITGAGSNSTWSDGEMHNAMVAFWSRFADKPLWAMWVLFARQHDQGFSLGGIMFDDIGPNHRQGTAIFTDSFIQTVPAGDPNPAAWRNRMVFWTAIHEMGHAFNLAHSWQKALGNPWIPLANEPEARSFMNYPFNVAGGQASFFSDFRFRFSDQELIFMRHAPRRFVQMGNSDWFVNHAFEDTTALDFPRNWRLEIRPNRAVNEYAFMEPVKLELKLTNASSGPKEVEADMLDDGKHIAVYVGREGGLTKRWSPFVTRCHEMHHDTIAPGASIYGAHMIGISTNGWLIDEPGFYTLQAAVDMNGEIVISNVLRIYVAPPASDAESKLAPDYFTEDVARVIAFEGAPELAKATDTLRDVVKRCPNNPAATHAAVAVSSPMLRNYKLLAAGPDATLTVKGTAAKVAEAAKMQIETLLKTPDAAADTMGHIDYFADLARLAEALEKSGDKKEAIKVLKTSIATMNKRGVIATVVKETETKLANMG